LVLTARSILSWRLAGVENPKVLNVFKKIFIEAVSSPRTSITACIAVASLPTPADKTRTLILLLTSEAKKSSIESFPVSWRNVFRRRVKDGSAANISSKNLTLSLTAVSSVLVTVTVDVPVQAVLELVGSFKSSPVGLLPNGHSHV